MNTAKTNHKITVTGKHTPIEKSQNGKTEKIPPGLPPIVWDKQVENTQIEKFRSLIEVKYKQNFGSYWDFQSWSVKNFACYWEEVWNYLGVITSKPYESVYRSTGQGFLECRWFEGAAFNFAENILRIRDDREALVCADELGSLEVVTFSEMFEEVKLYAAAFRKNGLRKGDRVACFMSHRKEAIFALLATASIGAILGGPQPYFGAKTATNVIKKMEPKFLITVDHHKDGEKDYYNMEYVPYIVENTPSLEKVIIVSTRSETLSRDFSLFPKSCLLEEFLNSGRTPGGDVPDLVFEQLPFEHPICVNFTSGTTGLPKGPLHSAGTLITHLANIVFSWNLNCGDVIYSCYPVGWTLFDTFIPCLAWGVKLFLWAGGPLTVTQEGNLWDICTKHRVTYAFLCTSIVDRMEKMDMRPAPNSSLENLKIVTIGGSPVKAQNYLYIQSKIKKDVFVCSQFGASESFGTFSGFDFNMPVYAGEIQAPGLGMDIQCYDSQGRSVLNQRGEMVIASPTPTLPIGLWRDDDNKIMKDIYLSKFPGVWYQSDEIWINPKTKGLVVIGRSDDTLIQNGEFFGAGDIYFAIHDMEEVRDYLCVSQTTEGGNTRAVLFVQMRDGHDFTPAFKQKIHNKIEDEIWGEFVPEVILETKGVPYNLNNKKMESIVRKIIATNRIPEVNNIRNAECLTGYLDIPEVVNYK